MYVIDVAGGDKVPRKGGPGVTQADLLVVNKIDLAEAVGADLGVMAREGGSGGGRVESAHLYTPATRPRVGVVAAWGPRVAGRERRVLTRACSLCVGARRAAHARGRPRRLLGCQVWSPAGRY